MLVLCIVSLVQSTLTLYLNIYSDRLFIQCDKTIGTETKISIDTQQFKTYLKMILLCYFNLEIFTKRESKALRNWKILIAIIVSS